MTQGGAIQALFSTLDISDTTFGSNEALGGAGGGLFVTNLDLGSEVFGTTTGTSTADIQGRCEFEGNEAFGGIGGIGLTSGADGTGYGGGLFVGGGTVTVSKKTKFAANHASTDGDDTYGSSTTT